mgnify:CR=1 FL=1
MVSIEAAKLGVEAGWTGEECKGEEIGDALVEFEGMTAKQWIGKPLFHQLLVYAD